jgi:FlaA1/EpsC-like NDP-sugar epimerase
VASNPFERHGAWPNEGAGPRLAHAASRVRVDLPLAALDIVLIAVSYCLVLIMRFEGQVPVDWWGRFAWFVPVACTVHVLANAACGGYGRWWRHAGIDEARRLILAGALSAIVLLTVFGFGPRAMPISVLIIGPIVATALLGLVRFQSRLFAFHRTRESMAGALRVVVVGAGRTGAAALREMHQNPGLGFIPVAIVDDDPALRHRSLHGVPIVGGIDKLYDVIRDRDVHVVLLAAQEARGEVARRVADAVNGTGVPIRVVRKASYWVHGAPLQHLRSLTIDDLLGRAQVELDDQPMRKLLHGRRVLITGGGGWIGTEIARQVRAFEPAELVLLDHDETHLFDAAQGLEGARMVLADVRDRDLMRSTFADLRPEVVFHAAAHKHVPMLEDYPCEAVLTNVLGTANVVDAARAAGVANFVAISTDKAARPTNVMGASKWLAEQIVLSRAPKGSAYCSVRFGNVLGSRGSVIPTFQRQIDAGGPVTVTDRSMTRYFMSTDEAVRFVLHAASMASGAAVLALDMGQRVNIYELAERMIRLSGHRVGHDIEIDVVGLRPGENLDEAMIGEREHAAPCVDGRLFSIVPVRLPAPVVDAAVETLATLASDRDADRAREVLLDIATPAAHAQPA